MSNKKGKSTETWSTPATIVSSSEIEEPTLTEIFQDKISLQSGIGNV